jgi:enoyl-CoA hydratase
MHGEKMSKLTYTIEDRSAVILMDDGKANAFDFEMLAKINQALDQAENDQAGLVIFAGREGLFCGGLNLKLLPTLTSAELQDLVTQFGRTMCRIFLFPAPTVAAITGHAIAGGLQLAFACDRRYAQDGPYRIQMNEMMTGMILPGWMLHISTRVVPVEWQSEVLLHAMIYSPAQALEKKLLNGVVPAGKDMVSAVKESCRDLMMIDRSAYAYTKRLMHGPGLEEALARLPMELARK